MDPKILSFNESQLKQSGFGEAFTNDLISKMDKGIPLIQHKFIKEIDGDSVEATLHLKKSTISDYYFLKKFDLELIKAKLHERVKHSFTITDTNFGTNKINNQHFKDESRYTLQEACNLLAGRSVYKNLVNDEGQHEHVWIKLHVKVDPQTDQIQKNPFDKTYGFDLDKTLNDYPIKELKYARMKQSLVQSLKRGNVKKVTLLGFRKQEEQFFISPNPGDGTLNVYDKSKQLLQRKELLERKLVRNDLPFKLGQRQDLLKQPMKATRRKIR